MQMSKVNREKGYLYEVHLEIGLQRLKVIMNSFP